MEKITSHQMWCFECQKEFSTQSELADAVCVKCNSPIIEKIESEPHINELKTQEIITRKNGNTYPNTS